MYVSQGPNFVWHIDCYDKLKPFDFPIHGAIDSFNRKIFWLNICPSNNDPYFISYFYVNCISSLKCVPKTIRGDRGSKNEDSMSGHSSFLFGSSANNQRIELRWSVLRRQNSAWWINFFKYLQGEGLFDPSLNHHNKCIKFCFSGILQIELDNIKEMRTAIALQIAQMQNTPGEVQMSYILILQVLVQQIINSHLLEKN